eukprot:TRINITY_DN6591_c0_g1_i1.p1 TRINITY_DN6591_c0_g1~~TRINITY_DN6591_c0_g1_i1.p1  ORF type:complete len:245 (+),score=19.73 TRINITY_DN6591_c0_g1_i1:333-1067(+)
MKGTFIPKIESMQCTDPVQTLYQMLFEMYEIVPALKQLPATDILPVVNLYKHMMDKNKLLAAQLEIQTAQYGKAIADKDNSILQHKLDLASMEKQRDEAQARLATYLLTSGHGNLLLVVRSLLEMHIDNRLAILEIKFKDYCLQNPTLKKLLQEANYAALIAAIRDQGKHMTDIEYKDLLAYAHYKEDASASYTKKYEYFFYGQFQTPNLQLSIRIWGQQPLQRVYALNQKTYIKIYQMMSTLT